MGLPSDALDGSWRGDVWLLLSRDVFSDADNPVGLDGAGGVPIRVAMRQPRRR